MIHKLFNSIFMTRMIHKLVLCLILMQVITYCVSAETDNALDYSIESQQQQQLPIRIVKHPESQVALQGARVTFKCDYEIASQLQSSTFVNDNSNVKLKWLHNLKAIKFDNYLIERNRLTILNYDSSVNSGQFRCLINNTLFSPPLVILSEPANLSLATIENFSEQKAEVTQLNLSEGNVAIITCKLPFSNPQAIPVYYLNDTQIQVSNDLRYRVFPSGNLQISNVKYSDSGVYRCSAKNPITNEIRDSSKRIHLRVFEPIGSKLPEIVYVPTDTNRIQIGANLTLECVANGAPVPLVSWEKFGGILPEKRSQQIFGNLIITNMQPEDKGTYVCRAENGPSQATFKTAMVDVFEAPALLKADDDTKFTLIAKQGETVELRCPIRSRPRSDIQWFYQGQQLFDNLSNYGDKSILTIRSFQSAKSTGIYQCYAQNEYGFQQANLLLIPYESVQTESVPKQRQIAQQPDQAPKRPIIIMGPQNTTIYEGQSVVLPCITSETLPGSNTQINWLQNELIIEPTLMRRFEINQLLGNLRIVSVQKSDAGVYRCIASNEFGMSTAEAYVTVKSSSELKSDDDSSKVKKGDTKKIPTSSSPVASKPSIQQIGTDKILLKWQIVDSLSGQSVESKEQLLSSIAYFKVEYKTNKQAQKASNVWLTIGEQIDAKKREYILTDLSKFETYRFRITTFFLNGDLTNSHNSIKFRLEQTWSPLSTVSSSASTVSVTTTASKLTVTEFKLSQIKVHITQIWAIASNSLGLRWQAYLPSIHNPNKTNDILLSKINGFYIYYRKINSQLNENSVIEASSDPTSSLIDPSSVPSVPLYNYTRINVPLTSADSLKLMVDTYIIANLDQASQYEIKMTCYNLNGDLCSFSNNLYGLTLTQTTLQSTSAKTQTTQDKPSVLIEPQQDNKTKQNEILFMILGCVLGILTLLLVIFIGMCVMRQRQHKMLLAQLHNTSQKLTSSSCPTLIYEDSLRNQNQHRQPNYASKLMEANLFANTTNDSNSTNSQSMSTTTSSMTTPPALISAQTNNDNMTPSHILLLNGNTVSTTAIGLQQPPPPIPQNPPPSMTNNTSTLNRININLNPLNNYLDSMPMSPNKQFTKQSSSATNENFYHTLTTLGNLPTANALDELNGSNYVDYNNTTLNLRAHLLLKQQQQQQQLLLNTLKQINMQKQINQFNLINENSANDLNSYAKSPSASSMRRNNSITSSKKSKKSLKSNKNSTNSVQLEQQQQQLLQVQQQQNKNYYLLPNMLPQTGFISQPPLINTIYNEADLLNIEAALNQNSMSLLNPGQIYLLNQTQFNPFTQTLLQQQNIQKSQLSPRNYQSDNDSNTPLIFPSVNTSMDKQHAETPIYETSETDEKDNHYASTGLMVEQQEKEPLQQQLN